MPETELNPTPSETSKQGFREGSRLCRFHRLFRRSPLIRLVSRMATNQRIGRPWTLDVRKPADRDARRIRGAGCKTSQDFVPTLECLW